MTTLHLSLKVYEVKKRPILFQGAMVRALLDGTKTQTRRIVKPQPDFVLGSTLPNAAIGKHTPDDEKYGRIGQAIHCPYGQTGDQLWVRETWAYGVHAMAANDHEREGPWVYAADGDSALRQRLCDQWRPSIHMFRAASRITLEINAVRVERLQDISEADAMKEGIQRYRGFTDEGPETCYHVDPPNDNALNGWESAKLAYSALWESINGPESWEVNPWVWVVEFTRHNAI